MPEVEYNKNEQGPKGTWSTRKYMIRELSTSRIDFDNPRLESINFEEGWSTDLTTLEAAMRKALSHADPGGQVSWAKYDEELAWKLMTERRWVDVEDFLPAILSHVRELAGGDPRKSLKLSALFTNFLVSEEVRPKRRHSFGGYIPYHRVKPRV